MFLLHVGSIVSAFVFNVSNMAFMDRHHAGIYNSPPRGTAGMVKSIFLVRKNQ